MGEGGVGIRRCMLVGEGGAEKSDGNGLYDGDVGPYTGDGVCVFGGVTKGSFGLNELSEEVVKGELRSVSSSWPRAPPNLSVSHPPPRNGEPNVLSGRGEFCLPFPPGDP
jgi:hypothetical protein